jgi:hypothetical protein
MRKDMANITIPELYTFMWKLFFAGLLFALPFMFIAYVNSR